MNPLFVAVVFALVSDGDGGHHRTDVRCRNGASDPLMGLAETLVRRTPSGSLVEKVWLFALFVSDEQPSMPAATDLAAPITDLTHLIWIAAPMPPKLRVSAHFDGVHAVGG